MKYKFIMSCGHTAEREVADPGKYYDLDRRYYRTQGLCDDLINKLQFQVKRMYEEIDKLHEQLESAESNDEHNKKLDCLMRMLEIIEKF